MKFQFNDCVIDTESRVLSRGGEEIDIEPQVFDLLVYLAEHRARVIGHDELIASVWNGRIVSDSAIAARISAARKAVGDSGKKQRIIKTVPRKGFRFLATVTAKPDDEVSDGPGIRSPEARPASPMAAHQQIRFCRSANGARIAYAVTGHGVPLVRTGHWLTHLEHDWHSPIWRPFLDRLGQTFEIVRYDQRGCGLSDWEIGDFSFERFAEDLEAVVSAAGRNRFVLFASSQGVPIAIDYAARNPDRVSHLVLLGGYVCGRLVRDDAAELEQGEAIIKLIEHGWGVVGSPFLQAFTTMYIPDATREQMDSLVHLQRTTTSSRNAVSIRRAVDSFDVTALLPRLNVDTLVIHAANDGVHPVEQGRELAAGIAGSEFVLLESSNHALLPQEPAWERFFFELERFVDT